MDSVLDTSAFSRVCGATAIGARLSRQYIASLAVFPDGTRAAVTRDGVYRAPGGDGLLRMVFPVVRGSRPLNLCVDQMGRLLFGEYGDGLGDPRIYVSGDGGRTFETLYAFPRGSIRHIHNIVPQGRILWVFTGDYGDEPGIAALSLDGTVLEWLGRGAQMFRAVGAIPCGPLLVYGTDSDVERNFIVSLDTRSGRIDRLCEIGGSSLYACRFGDLMLISSCVEPSEISKTQVASLYASQDSQTWSEVLQGEKDRLPPIFQYGTFVLPSAANAPSGGVFLSGQALSGYHDQVVYGTTVSAE